MRVRLGIIVPVMVQMVILYTYSAIKYSVLETQLVTFSLITVFPILVMYVLAPHFTAIITGIQNQVSKRLSKELDRIMLNEDLLDQTETRTQLLELKFPTREKISLIGDSLKARLVPLLTERAVNHYTDTYYSRTNEIKQEKSLEYFESLVLFSALSAIFFTLDLIIVWAMSFGTIYFYFIELDKIVDIRITFNLTLIFIFSIIFAYIILRYSTDRFLYYLPYVVPVLFLEPNDEQYLRRETIRSLLDYNLDNLVDRREQRRVAPTIESAIDSLLQPLLKDEILITARTEFAQKLAWREYYKLIQKEVLEDDDIMSSYLERLILGEKIGSIQIDDKDLLGLHADLEYINSQLVKWGELSEETRAFTYFQLYRIVEYIFKEICLELQIHDDRDDFNLYSAINTLSEMGYIGEDGKTALHNLRYRRNKLMHEPGVSLDVSQENIQQVIDEMNSVLTKMIEEN